MGAAQCRSHFYFIPGLVRVLLDEPCRKKSGPRKGKPVARRGRKARSPEHFT